MKGGILELHMVTSAGFYDDIHADLSAYKGIYSYFQARMVIFNMKKQGFETTLKEAQDPLTSPRPEAALPLKMEVQGLDHPGIVQALVSRLHQHSANIQSLNTHITHAPLSGAPLFNLLLEVEVPTDVPIADIKGEMTEIAREMNLDLIFTK